MAGPCFVLFLRFLCSRSFSLLYLLYIHTQIYIKRMLNTVVNYFHLAGALAGVVWVGGGHVGEPSENQKNDRETGQQQQQQHLILSLSRRKPQQQQNKKECAQNNSLTLCCCCCCCCCCFLWDGIWFTTTFLLHIELGKMFVCFFWVFVCVFVNEAAMKRRVIRKI